MSLAVLGVTGALTLTGLTPAPALAAGDGAPDFGPNVKIFDPGTPVSEINAYLQGISAEDQFSSNRHAVLFKPGTYGSAAGAADPSSAGGILDSPVGYYTSIAGLGSSPQDVVVNGALHVDHGQSPFGPSALDTFWRSLGNLTVDPIQPGESPHTLSWAVSQATPLRRVNVQGNLDLTGPGGALAFGSYLADSRVSGTVGSGDATAQPAQAQWYTRDSSVGSWSGTGVNVVFSGVQGAPASTTNPPSTTSLPSTPVSRQAPFLFLDGGRYEVFVPSVRTNTRGADWSTARNAGTRLPISAFFIAKPTDTAARINAALASGKNLLLTPGIYALDSPLHVTRPDTVVMGLGYATITPTRGTAVLEIGNAPGVVVSGLTVDAGPVASDVLVRVGTPGRHTGHAMDPTTLSDLFVRVGGATAGVAATSVQIDSDHVLLDDSWIWRADHGAGSSWTSSPIDHGLVVNGDDVTALGLFVEHFQKEQVVWNGERGRTIFYESEMPEGMPGQAVWMDGSREGYASYVVGNGVRKHDATGLAVYALFPFPPTEPVHAWTAIQAPVSPQVSFRSTAAGVVLGQGGIRHVINDAGAAVDAAQANHVYGMTALTWLAAYPR